VAVSAGAGGGADSRPTNYANSADGDRGRNSADLGSRELPTPSEREAEFHEEYEHLAGVPLTTRPGDSLREEYTRTFEEEWTGESYGPFERTPKGQRTTAVEAVEWGEAVGRLLDRHEERRHTSVNISRGRPDEALYAEFSVPVENRWMEGYQRSTFAQLKAWVRELVGGERPSGGESEGAFDDPHVVLFGLTASSTPDGERIGPVRHATAIQEAWSPTYQKLRTVLRRLGFSSEEWQYMQIREPHDGKRGGGANTGYLHGHPLLIVDGEIAPEDLAPVVEEHVEECEFATADAHDLDDAVTVKAEAEVADVASYMAGYCGIEPMDLLERPPEYIAWAAAMDAANVRTMSRSDAARNAAVADACKQRCESPEADQEAAHGEEVVRARSTARHSFECAECGSPWEIDQEGTLTAHRTADAGPAAADGGREVSPQHAHTAAALADAWPSAREAAAVGEGPDAARQRSRIRREAEGRDGPDPAAIAGATGEPPPVVRRVLDELACEVVPSEVAGFLRPPQWSVKSVTVRGEEHPAGPGGGVEMVEIEPRGAARQEVRAALDEKGDYVCECGVHAWGMDMARHLYGYHGIGEADRALGLVSDAEY